MFALRNKKTKEFVRFECELNGDYHLGYDEMVDGIWCSASHDEAAGIINGSSKDVKGCWANPYTDSLMNDTLEVVALMPVSEGY